jgi:hypothetical protein
MFAHRLNLEDNSEIVRVGKAIHEDKAKSSENSEIKIDNIALDKINSKYVVEIKKSDADIEACKWQLLYYLKILKDKGIERKGKLEFIEKNKTDRKIIFIELNEEIEKELNEHISKIEELLSMDELPTVINKPACKKCAYYEYCYI